MEDRLITVGKMRWAERQVERAHVKNLTEGRPKPSGINEVSHPRGGWPRPAYLGKTSPQPRSWELSPMLGVLTSPLAAAAKGKGKGQG